MLSNIVDMSSMVITGECSCISSEEGVKSDFASGDTSAASCVGIPTHIVRTTDATCQVDRLAMIGNRHCRIDVKFVKDIPACTTILPLDFSRQGQDMIVMIVIMILCFVPIDSYLSIDHTATNV